MKLTVGQAFLLACGLSGQGANSAPAAHFQENASGTAKLLAAPPLGSQIDRTGWTVTCDSFEPGNECAKAIDGDMYSFWHTKFVGANLPHQIVVDMGSVRNVNGISTQPRQDGTTNGFIAQHEVAVSTDGQNWEVVASGSWYTGDALKKYANFDTKSLRYIRIKALSEVNGNQWSSIADIQAFESNTPPAAYNGNGKWGQTIDFPTVPVAGTVDPTTGKVLIWSAYTYDNYQGGAGDRVYTSIWDPATNTVIPKMIDSTDHDMFCPGISIDGTGNMVVTGGNSAQKTTLYNFATASWIPGPDMNVARGYQASATCSDGRVFTIGGSWSGGWFKKNGEIYDPKTKTWTSLPSAIVDPMLTQEYKDAGNTYRADNHAWLFGWKNGTVFQAGPSTAMNWYTMAGNGGVTSAGKRQTTKGVDPDAMNGNAVMFDAVKGQILTFGGAPHYEWTTATTNANIITIGDPGSQAQVKPASGGMYSPRSFHASVVLPDGKVFITGGQSMPVTFSDDTAQFTPEVYDPVKDTFTQQMPNTIPRTYHSIALLLPDGRVLSGGGGLCGGCTTNHFDGQIFTPQNLLTSTGALATRPVIKSASSSGGKITISTDSAVSSASLIRYGTATHTVNTDQRRIPLTLTSAGTNQYTAILPTDSGIMLPGYYMLFVMNANGVPSVAKTMNFLMS